MREWVRSNSNLGAAVCLVLLASLTPGCSYTSSYVAPADGRARVVWDNDAITVAYGGAKLSQACLAAVMDTLASPPKAHAHSPSYWVPVYYYAFAPWGRPVFLPHLYYYRSFAHASLYYSPYLYGPYWDVGFSFGPWIRHGYVGHSGSRSSEEALVALAAIVIVTLSVTDIVIASMPSYDEDAAIKAIDWVGAFNDLARTPGSACDFTSKGGRES